MWKPEQRVVADRSGLRYPSDLTEAECELAASLTAGIARVQLLLEGDGDWHRTSPQARLH